MTRRKRFPAYVPQAIGAGGYSVSGSGVNARWDNLVAGWHLNESSDGSAPVARADVLGTYTLTDNNTVASASGLIGNAMHGISADATYLSHATLSFTGGVFTAVAWFNPDNLAANTMIWGCETANTGFRSESRTTGAVNSTIYDAGGAHALNVAGALSAGSWTMFVLWCDGSKTYVAFNGGASSNISFVPAANTGLRLGKNLAGHASFEGLVDEAYLFSDAKDATWRTNMYNGGAGRSYPD